MNAFETFDPVQNAHYCAYQQTLDDRVLKLTERDAVTARHSFALAAHGEQVNQQELSARITDYMGFLGLHMYLASVPYLAEPMRRPAWVRRQSGMLDLLLADIGQPQIWKPRLEAAEIDDADLAALPNTQEIIVQTLTKILVRAELKFANRLPVTGEVQSLIVVRAAEASSRPVLSFGQRRDRAHGTLLRNVRSGKWKPPALS